VQLLGIIESLIIDLTLVRFQEM